LGKEQKKPKIGQKQFWSNCGQIERKMGGLGILHNKTAEIKVKSP
jgi:hypothetical protein